MARVRVLAAHIDLEISFRISDAIERYGSQEVLRLTGNPQIPVDQLVVVATPEAARSHELDEVIRAFLRRHSPDDVAIVLVRGQIGWSGDRLTTDALPRILADQFKAFPPLYIDGRENFDKAVGQLAAALAGIGRFARVRLDAPSTVSSRERFGRPDAPAARPARTAVWISAALVLGVVAAFGLFLLTEDDTASSSGSPARSSLVLPVILAALAVVLLGLVICGAAYIIRCVGSWVVNRRDRKRVSTAVVAIPESQSDELNDVVFISYASRDQRFAERLADDLRGFNQNVFFSPDSLKTGQWIFQLDSGLRRSKAFILLMSTAAFRSGWVRAELSAAFVLEVDKDVPRIIPIELEPCDPPVLLRSHQTFFLRDGYDHVLERLEHTLA